MALAYFGESRRHTIAGSAGAPAAEGAPGMRSRVNGAVAAAIKRSSMSEFRNHVVFTLVLQNIQDDYECSDAQCGRATGKSI